MMRSMSADVCRATFHMEHYVGERKVIYASQSVGRAAIAITVQMGCALWAGRSHMDLDRRLASACVFA